MSPSGAKLARQVIARTKKDFHVAGHLPRWVAPHTPHPCPHMMTAAPHTPHPCPHMMTAAAPHTPHPCPHMMTAAAPYTPHPCPHMMTAAVLLLGIHNLEKITTMHQIKCHFCTNIHIGIPPLNYKYEQIFWG